MGLFDRFTGGKGNVTDHLKLSWIPLTDVNQINDILNESEEQTVAVFKHSTRCGISNMVLRGFEGEFNIEDDKIKLYFLDILNHRDISNEIASRFNVWHESPQILIFQNKEVAYHTSHGNIQASKLNEFV